jgi:Tat protein translocase TatB subunit
MSFFPSLAVLGGSIGTGEWVVLFVVVLIVVGPKRLPEMARKAGRMMEMFRRAADEFKDQLMNMDQETSSGGGHAPPGGTSPASDASGHQAPAEPYENPYPDTADYPGNEDQVENWAESQTSPGAAAAEGGDTDKPAEPAP